MARLFLNNESYSISNANTQVLGSINQEVLSIANTALGTSINSNVEQIQFEGAIADYKFSVQGTQLWVYQGLSLLANIGIQTDSNGTALTFSDLTTTATLTGLNIAKLGKASLSTIASSISASQVAGTTNTLLTQAQTKSQSKTTYDSAALLTASSNVVQSLDSDYSWSKTALTYSYNTSIPSDYVGISVDSSQSGNLTTGWQATNQLVKDSTTAIMSSINTLTNVSITQISTGGDIRFNMLPTASNVAAFAYFPGSSGISGDVFIKTDIDTSLSYLSDGGYGDLTITHELGHALGLKHPFEGGVTLPTSQDHHVHSIMSYTDYKDLVPVFTGTKTANSTSVNMRYDNEYPDSFMVYDIAALQSMYGVNLTTNTGNNTYYFDPAGTVRTANYEEGAFYFSLPIYHSIWDAGGTDTLNFATTTHSNTVKLTSGSYSALDYRSVATQISDQQAKYYADLGTHYYDSWVADVYNNYATKIYTGENALGIAYGTVIENAVGGSAADTFYDNNVNNALTGNAGDDVFYMGAGGFDTITGGDGTDKVVLSFSKVSTQIEKQAAGNTLVVASGFALSLVGVESIQFSDQLYSIV